MNEYLITYDLSGSDRDYQEVDDAINRYFPGSWHEMGSVWVIRTRLPAKAIRRHLMLYLEKDDRILVVKLDDDYSGYGYKNKFKKWRAKGDAE